MSRQFLVLGLLAFISGIHSHDDPESNRVTLEEVPVVAEDVSYISPVAEPGKFYFADHFDDVLQFHKKWIKSEAKKDGADEDIAKYDGKWSLEAPQKVLLKDDLGLVLKSKAKHAAIAARLDRPFVFSDKPLIVQYEVTLQDGQECGGSYIKLLSSGKDTTDLRTFHDRTPYSIMFGPDKCGNDHKLHFIFRHTNPLNGSVEEKHCKKPRERIEEPFRDKLPHLYRLTLWPDNTFTVHLDKRIVNEGSLLQDFTPPVNPPSEIADPTDSKPADWDDREKIPDPDAVKPEDWNEEEPPQIPDNSAVKPEGWLDDENEMIADPAAIKPEDWDSDMDGEWEAPLIPNPACEGAVGCGLWKAPFINNPNYKGKWRAPYITNPNYKGKWSPRMIANPGYFQDLEPFKMAPIAAVGIELWSMSQDILFDNIIITDNYKEADNWAALTFDLKQKQIDITAGSLTGRILKSLNYKPGWWALYFVYCCVPIVLYVWYLLRRAREESVFGRLLKYTNDNPWLWAVYTVAIALPLAIMLFFCCSSSNKDKEEQNRNNAKKTDAVSPDDQAEEKTQYESIAKTEKKVEETQRDSEELESPDMEVDENEVEDEEEVESTPEPEAVGEENIARKRKPRRE